MQRTLGDRLGMIAKLETISAVVLMIVAGPGHRFGLIPTKIALLMTLAALVLGAIALLFGLAALFMKSTQRNTPVLLGALTISGILSLTLVSWVMKGASVPQIHDITTDLDTPPQFVALAGARIGAANPDAYPGEDVAQQQRDAYPDLAALRVTGQSIGSVLDAAEQAAIDQGWEAVVRTESQAQIEATDVTAWFGYKDDIIIRVTDEADAIVVDVRSKSRVGQSDLGTNAARISDYLAALSEKIEN